MNIHILYNFKGGPWGGGNQFLKSLKKEFFQMGIYEENPEKSDIILFNSHQSLRKVLNLKSKYPEKILIHRLGPVFHLYRNKTWKKYDEGLMGLTNKIADGVIFQSAWSLKEAIKLGFDKKIPSKIIYNSANSDIFNKNNKKNFHFGEKIKLIATSWSANWEKGFDIYKFLDENLDFSKYQMTFVGNAPLAFRNIKSFKPVPSEKLAEILKDHDIYVFASKIEACSNALIEALSCALPAVAMNSSSNPEILAGGGELFNGREDVIEKIDKVAQNYPYYQSKIPEFSTDKTAGDYYQFGEEVGGSIKKGILSQKRANFLTRISFYKMRLFNLIKI